MKLFVLRILAILFLPAAVFFGIIFLFGSGSYPVALLLSFAVVLFLVIKNFLDYCKQWKAQKEESEENYEEIYSSREEAAPKNLAKIQPDSADDAAIKKAVKKHWRSRPKE